MKMHIAGLALLLCTSLTFAQRGIGPIVNSVPNANPHEGTPDTIRGPSLQTKSSGE
jgi:hypothetical protein